MKKSLLVAIVFTIQVSALEIEVESGDAFNKVMSKNRANKHIKGANHVVIKNKEDLEAHAKKDLGLTVDSSTVRAGTVYNYVEIKNVKNNFEKTKKRTTNKYNSKNKKDETRNIGVKIKTSKGFNRGFKGKVHNSVKIENSQLD